MQTHEVRQNFLEYFKKKHHAIIASSPVVPHDDPTLLFTNAGMNQFKDVFLGTSVRDYKKAATSQKCIRVGGKHNDLDNVGHTQRHLTFFEMLGNFSFGDYFKGPAIDYAWEVSTEVLGLNPEHLWASVFREDDEAFELWKKHLPEKRIFRLDEKDNFWAMGDTGPCGPCSELYYDKGKHFGTAHHPKEDSTGERYLEFWNLVFMEYNKDPHGTIHKLPKPSIDTGAGIERVMSLIQKKENVFETDVLRALIAQIESLSGIDYDPLDEKKAPPFHVIADHLRCLAFAISDGAQPSNVDRGYVLRKVLRRAVRYGKILGLEKPFLADVLPSLVGLMGKDYKELAISQNRIAEILTKEEEAFIKTLKRGGNILSQVIEKSKEQISGDDAFKLKDTYGLPFEEILLIAKDSNLSVDKERFEKLELEAKEKSKTAQKTVQQMASTSLFEEFVYNHGECEFLREAKAASTQVAGIICEKQFVTSLEEGQKGMILLKATPFYAEMGGQVGDTGSLESAAGTFIVEDCQVPFKGVIAHIGTVEKGALRVGQEVVAKFDHVRRQKIANNHTATHLLHWALGKVLGGHIKQAGSVVDEERLRFDFSHHKPLTDPEIREIERLVNEKIRENREVAAYEIPYEEAVKKEDIKQFFGEKYGSTVRVIDIDFSKELCGGTHTSRTGNIGYFRIAKESSIAAGMRRIEAVTGHSAEELSYVAEDTVKQAAELIKSPKVNLVDHIAKMQEEVKGLEGELKAHKRSSLTKLASELKKETKNGVLCCITRVDIPAGELKNLIEEVATQMPSSIICLATTDSQKAHIAIRISHDLVEKGFKAQELIKKILPLIEGNGGGKNDYAQGAGQAQNIDKALNALIALI